MTNDQLLENLCNSISKAWMFLSYSPYALDSINDIILGFSIGRSDDEELMNDLTFLLEISKSIDQFYKKYS